MRRIALYPTPFFTPDEARQLADYLHNFSPCDDPIVRGSNIFLSFLDLRNDERF